MMASHTVKQGDSIYSIAHEHGLSSEALWDHPDNAALRRRRKVPGILFPW